MKKPIIGIISNRSYLEENRTFTKSTNFSSLVIGKISSFGGFPLGILFPYGKFDDEIMKMCDGFVFQGGSRIELCQLLAMSYVMNNKLPVLGICNGMQTMAGFEYTNQYVQAPTSYNLSKFYDKDGESGFLYPVDGHNKENPFYIENINNAKHKVYLEEDSRLSYYFDTSIVNGVSVHNYAIKPLIFDNSEYFYVTGRSSDGVIEGIEAKDTNHFAIGVQYHIELENENDILFKELIEESSSVMRLKK